MSHKSWTFTTYEDGKPVTTQQHLNHDQALVALRAAIAGEPVLSAIEGDSQVSQPVAELARAA